jgi:hypothetical protein
MAGWRRAVEKILLTKPGVSGIVLGRVLIKLPCPPFPISDRAPSIQNRRSVPFAVHRGSFRMGGIGRSVINIKSGIRMIPAHNMYAKKFGILTPRSRAIA